jgi:prepilin-type N-terminal cleavage/methylation domain-containing protein
MTRRTDESGFTLIELVVTVTLFGLVAVILGNIFMNVTQSFHTVASGTDTLNTRTLTAAKIEKAVRNSTKVYAADDGASLHVIDAEGADTVWRMSDRGLTNGSWVADGLTTASFSASTRLVHFTLGEGNDAITKTVHPRLAPPLNEDGAGAALTVSGEWIHQDE